jgi:non-specific protein-tyrosine kinase
MPHGDEAERDLHHYLRVVRAKKWTIILATFVVVGAALGASYLQTPTYRATAQMLLQPRVSNSVVDPNTGQLSSAVGAQTEIQVIQSKPVVDAVVKKLGSAPPIHAAQVGQSDIIILTAESTDPRRASAAANAYAYAYIDFRRTQAIDDLLAAGTQIQAKVDELQKQVDALNGRLPVPATPVPNQPARQPTQSELSIVAQRTSLLNQQALFKAKLDQLQVDAALKNGDASVVTPASVPISPFKPRPKRTGALAAALGLLFGIGLAFLFDYMDDSLKTKEELERAVQDAPVLGLIPAVSGWKDRSEPRVVSLKDPSSPAAEAYRSLRTSLNFLALDRPLRTVQVTSPNASEGKTTTLANLAVALARSGQQVIVVCCDLRRPRIHDFFGLSNEVGFTSVLLGEVPLSVALQQVPGEERLRVLPSGPLPPNPSELLSSRRTIEVLTTMQVEADIVLVDSAPVLPVTDAAVLSGRVDATLLVATAHRTTAKEMARAADLLRQVHAPLLGTVLNGIVADSGYGYSYYYRPYQSEPSRRRPATMPS